MHVLDKDHKTQITSLKLKLDENKQQQRKLEDENLELKFQVSSLRDKDVSQVKQIHEMKSLLKKFYHQLTKDKSAKAMDIDMTPENPAIMKYIGASDRSTSGTTERGKFSPRSAESQQIIATRARNVTVGVPYSADKIISSNEGLFDPSPSLFGPKYELDEMIKERESQRPPSINTGERLKGNGVYNSSSRISTIQEEEVKQKDEKKNTEGSPQQNMLERQGSRRSPLRKTTALNLEINTHQNTIAPLENKQCT